MPACCCGRTFTGRYSDGETTTALVRDIRGLTREDYETALSASRDNRSQCTCPFDTPRMANTLIRRAARWPEGAVVSRRLDVLAIREPVSP